MADLVNTTGGITRLNTNNYQSWRSRIKSYLEGQDLWEVVNGNDTKPPKNAEQLQIWKVKAAKAMYVLKSTIEDWLLGRIRDDDTPNMAWDTFASLFLKTSDARLQYGVGDTDFTPVEADMRVMRMDPELYKAAQQGDVEYLQRNRTEEAGSQVRRSDEFFLMRTQHGDNNILHIAARAGRDIFVAEALRHFPVLSGQVNTEGDTPLLVAARFGHLEVVKKLAETRSQIHEEMAATVDNITNSSQRDLEQGLADRQLDVLLINSEQGTTAIHEALRNGHEDVARYLLKLKPEMATFHSRAGESPLFLAAESCCQEFVVDILRSGWPYSTKGPDGQNVLHAARNCDDRNISELLIKQEPDLMRQLDYRGKAAIHYAVEPKYEGFFYQMLEADPSIALFRDADGYTPLLRAASRGYLKVCQAILQKCLESVEARNYQGQNALHLFESRKKRDWEELFKIPEIGQLLNIVDYEGNTPLHLALMKNNKDKAIFLIGRDGIHLGAVNKQGLTALDLCESKWKQGLTFVLLAIQGAPNGRRPKKEEVPVGGRDLKPFINTMTLVATLIATITFAAAFTMPGGFDTNPANLGVAVLVKKASLKVFILADSIAMCCSMAVMFLLMWAMIAEEDVVQKFAHVSSVLLPYALVATLVAFVSGIFAVIAPKALWVTILVCIFCGYALPSILPGSLLLFIWDAYAVFPRLNAKAIISITLDGFLKPVADLIMKAREQGVRSPT